MEFQFEQVSQVEGVLKGTISKEELEQEKKRVAKKLAKQVKLDGFRPGKVPPQLVERLYRDSVISEALDNLVRKLLEEGLKDVKISLSPRVEKVEEKEDGSYLIEVRVALPPKVEVDENYLDCVPEVEVPEVTEEEIQKELEAWADRVSESKPVQKEALEKGDIAVIDFEGFIDGKPFEGGKGEAYSLEIGSGQFIEGFEDQLVGMKVGEERTIEVTFPENYHEPKLAGKKAQFKVTLQEIQQKKKAPIDDTLAQKVMNDQNATLEQFKEEIKKQLLAAKKREVYEKYKDQILECLLNKYRDKVEVSQLVVDEEKERVIREELSQLPPEEQKKLEKDREKLEMLAKEAEETARDRVILTLIVSKLIEREQIKVSQEELLNVIYLEALRYGADPTQLYNYYKENNLLPVIQMEIAKDKLIYRLLDKKNGSLEGEEAEESKEEAGADAEKGEE